MYIVVQIKFWEQTATLLFSKFDKYTAFIERLHKFFGGSLPPSVTVKEFVRTADSRDTEDDVISTLSDWLDRKRDEAWEEK